MDPSDAIRRRARDQLSVVSRRQLLDAGVTAGQIRWCLGRTWRMVLPGVVLLGPGLPTTDQRHVAALLYAGPSSWLSGPTALVRHGWPETPTTGRVHVLVPDSKRGRDVSWLSIRRTSLLDERIVARGPLRYSSLPRALVDAAALAPDEATTRALVIDAVQRRVVRLDDVAHWIDARRPNGSIRLRAALSEAAVGAWSVPEADLARLVATSRVLTGAWLNPSLHDADGKRLTTPDLWFDDVALAVMVHSRAFHAGALDWEGTVESDSDLTSARVAVVGVTPTSIARDPAAVLRRVESAYLSARSSGFRPDVTATPRALWAHPATG